MGQNKTLIHVHTNYSFDARTSPEELVRAARRAGIGCIAVTDHDTIEGARHVAAITDLDIIIGEEVSTSDGHLLGLFLREHVPAGMSVRETAKAIRAQGGLVFVPHPFIRFGGCALGETVTDILDLIDAVEVCNAQSLWPVPDRKARRFAAAHGLPGFVGADTHVASSVAPGWQSMPRATGPGDFMAALRQATLCAGRHPLPYYASAAYRTLRYAATGTFPRGFGANYRAPESRFPAELVSTS